MNKSSSVIVVAELNVLPRLLAELDACDMGRTVAEEGGQWRALSAGVGVLFLASVCSWTSERTEGGERRTGESRAEPIFDPIGGKG
jgi:hypothetical protein